MQVISPSFYKKEIVNDISSNKPFLIVFSSEQLSNYEQEVFDLAIVLFEGNGFKLLSLNKEELFRNSAIKEFEMFEEIKSSLIRKLTLCWKPTNNRTSR